MSPQVMLFLLQAMFWAGFSDPGRPPRLLLVSPSPRSLALSLSLCMRREIIPSPHGHTTKKFGCKLAACVVPPKQIPQNTTESGEQAWQCCCPMADALSLSARVLNVMQEDQVGNKKLGGGRGDTSRREREHIWSLQTELISLYTLFV
jgi:hypothetical protein